MVNKQSALQVIECLFGVCSMILNAVGLFLLIRQPFKSFLTNFLFRALCISNIYSGLSIFLYNICPPYVVTESMTFNAFVCKLWNGENMFWHGIAISTLSMVAISFDRFIAVLFPSTYKCKLKHVFMGMLVTFFILFVLLSVTLFLRNEFIGGKCVSSEGSTSNLHSNLLRAGRYIWLAMVYFLPIICFTATHGVIVCVFRHRQLTDGPQPSVDSDQGSGMTSGFTNNHALRRIIINSLLMSANVVLFHSITAITYIITDSEIIHQIGVTLLTFSTLTTPFIMVSTIPHLKRAVAKLFAQLRLKSSRESKRDSEITRES